MEEWKKVRLGDVCSFQEGYVNPSQNNSEYFDGPIKWLRATDLNNGFVYNTTRTLSQKGFDSAGKSALLFKPDTIGISKSGTIGRLGILKDYMCGNRAVINIAPNTEVDTMFIFYTLLNMQGKFENLAVGSVQKNLYVPILAEIKIKLPPLPTQQKIAAILSSLDDKIELNNKINTNLEQQAQALFKNWFVDKSDLYQKMPLGKVVSKANVGGDAIKKTPIVEEDTGIRCIRIGDLTNKRPYKEWGFAKVSDENFIRYKLHKYDIVLARTAVLGLNRIIYEDLNAVYNNGMIKLEANPKIILPLFLYCQMNTQDYKNYMNRIVAETSVRPNMKANYLLDYQLIVPDLETQKKFEKIATGIYEQINNNEKENDRLSSLRDTLLPKLMNGEIEV